MANVTVMNFTMSHSAELGFFFSITLSGWNPKPAGRITQSTVRTDSETQHLGGVVDLLRGTRAPSIPESSGGVLPTSLE